MKKLLLVFVLGSFIITEDTVSQECPKNFWCVECDETKCDECVFSYANDDKLCVSPATEIDNCINYENATTCSLCRDGYYVSGSVCKENTLDGCLIQNLEDATKCYSCADSKQVDKDGKCIEDACPSNCKNCIWDDDKGLCLLCEEGYVRNSEKVCITETTTTKNCFKLNEDGTCKECRFGFYDDGTNCIATTVYEYNHLTINLTALSLLIIFLK